MAARVFSGVGRAVTQALGEAVTFTPQGGSAASLQGVFTRDYIAAGKDGDLSVESVSPAVSVRAVDAPSLAQGDGFTIEAIDYVVVEVMPDGLGMVTALLHEAS